MAKHDLEGVSVGDNANLHNLPCICIKMVPAGTFFTFLVIAGLKGEEESLEHGKTWFGKPFCRLVVYSKLHSLPCICIKMASTGTYFSIFL